MKVQWRKRVRELTVVAAACAAGLVSLEAASRGGAQLFTGGGFGPTAATAVQAAIWDAEASASAEGLYTCQLVGEPVVFPQPPGARRAFTAEATLSCTP